MNRKILGLVLIFIIGGTSLTGFYIISSNTNSTQNLSLLSIFLLPNQGTVTLPTPTGVSASDGTSEYNIHITWDEIKLNPEHLEIKADPNPDYWFKLYRSTSLTGPYELIHNSSSNEWLDGISSPGILYYYKVQTYSNSSNYYTSSNSTPDSGYRRLLKPGGLDISDGLYTSGIFITWSSVIGADDYYIYRSTSISGPFIFLGTASSPYNDTTAIPGTLYNYNISAYASSSNSFSYNSTDDGYRKLETPTGVSASEGLTDRIEISFDSVQGANRYCVYRSDNSTGPYVYRGNSTTSPYTDLGVAPYQDYYYIVRAYADSSDSYSEYSDYDVGSCDTSG